MTPAQMEDAVTAVMTKHDCNNSYDYLEIEAIRCKDKSWEVYISRMYNRIPFSFAILKDLAEVFGTEDFKTDYEINNPGCETCDYGSQYGMVFIFAGKEDEARLP